MPTPISAVPYYHEFVDLLDKFALSEKHDELWKFADSVWTNKPGDALVKPEWLSDNHAHDIVSLLMDRKNMLPKLEVENAVTMTAVEAERWIKQQPAQPNSALDVQVDGNHYKDKAIQPVEYIHANGLGFLEGCIVKRITRWRDKDGFTDLEKIKHEVDLLIELERRSGNRAVRSS